MNSISHDHPAGPALDALAIGEGDAQTRTHAETCATCAAYVEAVAKGAAAFASNEGTRADAFVASVQRRDRARVRRIPWVGAVASAVVLAAGTLLFVHAQSASAPNVPPVAVESSEGPIRFKGGTQVAIIVEHDGSQTRETGASLGLEPGDRIRAEIALDHDERIVAGALADNGEWAELEPPAMLNAGTHYSEQSVVFSGEVPPGWILIGKVDDVARARRTHDFHDVKSIRIYQK